MKPRRVVYAYRVCAMFLCFREHLAQIITNRPQGCQLGVSVPGRMWGSRGFSRWPPGQWLVAPVVEDMSVSLSGG